MPIIEKGLETFFMLDYTLREIKGGVPMGKNVTIVQIAKECGVSAATVSRVWRNTPALACARQVQFAAALRPQAWNTTTTPTP